MRTFVRLFKSGAWLLSVVALIGALSNVTRAEPVTPNDAVYALTANSPDTLLVLQAGSLVFLGDDATGKIALPAFAGDAHPTSLATGADGKIYLGGPGVGVWVYDGVSQSWQSLNATLPELNVSSVAAHATEPETLYAYLPEKGIFRSRDGGGEWVKVDSGPQEPVQTFLHSNMPGSMETGWLFAGTRRGVARSMDCFCFWGDAGDLRGSVTSITFNPDKPENVYALVDGEVQHSGDGGETWNFHTTPGTVTAISFSKEKGLIVGTTIGNVFERDSAEDWVRIYE